MKPDEGKKELLNKLHNKALLELLISDPEDGAENAVFGMLKGLVNDISEARKGQEDEENSDDEEQS